MDYDGVDRDPPTGRERREELLARLQPKTAKVIIVLSHSIEVSWIDLSLLDETVQ